MIRKIVGITGLSNRTVEFYLNQAKSKLGCKVKEDLINKVFEREWFRFNFIRALGVRIKH
jgi:hypothetical protein